MSGPRGPLAASRGGRSRPRPHPGRGPRRSRPTTSIRQRQRRHRRTELDRRHLREPVVGDEGAEQEHLDHRPAGGHAIEAEQGRPAPAAAAASASRAAPRPAPPAAAPAPATTTASTSSPTGAMPCCSSTTGPVNTLAIRVWPRKSKSISGVSSTGTSSAAPARPSASARREGSAKRRRSTASQRRQRALRGAAARAGAAPARNRGIRRRGALRGKGVAVRAASVSVNVADRGGVPKPLRPAVAAPRAAAIYRASPSMARRRSSVVEQLIRNQ